MKAIDLKDKFEDILKDSNKVINEESLKETCQINQKNNTCRYIIMRKDGVFICSKNTCLRSFLDKMVEKEQIESRGNNCLGL